MSNGKIYIAGKITGDPDYIVNPVEEVPQKWPWWRQMMRCLRLVSGCKVVAMLPDWNDSRGERIEHGWAKFLRKQLIYLY